MTRATPIGRSSVSQRKPAERHLRSLESSEAGGAERVRAFFAERLPRVIAHRGDLFDLGRGSLAIFVEGAGSWTIRFGDHASPDALINDASFESDCVTVFSVAGFVALLDGRAGGATPVLIGDARLLSRVGQLMIEPARGVLGARLSP